jgi:hypothetical protein
MVAVTGRAGERFFAPLAGATVRDEASGADEVGAGPGSLVVVVGSGVIELEPVHAPTAPRATNAITTPTTRHALMERTALLPENHATSDHDDAAAG